MSEFLSLATKCVTLSTLRCHVDVHWQCINLHLLEEGWRSMLKRLEADEPVAGRFSGVLVA